MTTLDPVVADLEHRIAIRNKRNEERRQATANREAVIAAMQARQQERRSGKAEIARLNGIIEQVNGTAAKEKAEADAARQFMRGELAVANKALSKAQTDLEQAARNTARLEAEVARLHEELQSSDAAYNKLRAEASAAAQANDKLARSAAIIVERNKQLEAQVAELSKPAPEAKPQG